MPTTWYITANAGRARFFAESDRSEPLQEIEDMVNSAARLRVSETESDKMGPTAATSSGHGIGSNQGVGMAHNAKAGAPNKAYQPEHTPAEQEAEQFAKDISKYLMDAHQQGRFDRLIISASPQFLGALRSSMDPQLKLLVKTELNKDYTHSNAQQLREQVQAQQDKAE